MSRITTWLTLALLVLSVRSAFCTEPDGSELVIDKLECQYTKPMSLKGRNSVPVKIDGVERETPVKASIGRFNYASHDLKDGVESKAESGKIHEYRLQSTDKDLPFSWSVWSAAAYGEFQLIRSGDGKCYLGWVSASSVYFCEVTAPNDRAERLCSALAGHPDRLAGISLLPAGILSDDVRSWGVNAHYCDIVIKSIEKDSEGVWTVQIASPKGVSHAFVSDPSQKLGWRMIW